MRSVVLNENALVGLAAIAPDLIFKGLNLIYLLYFLKRESFK